jgi:hypothetical protein
VAVALTAALAAAVVARAEVQQDGILVVDFDGGISPHSLPRSGAAPVSVGVEATIKTTDGSDPPPQLREISVAINREGEIFNRGLPTCRIREIQPTTIRAARRICGRAIIGSGSVAVRIHLPNQPPFTFMGPLLAFNAKPVGGKRRILAQVYGLKPPSAFVLNFKILQRPGTFGTVIRTSLPKAARRWAYVTRFEMRLRRTYLYRGKRRSYVSAGCAAPEGFPGAVYPFAKGTFKFDGGRRITTTLIRDCKVRGD